MILSTISVPDLALCFMQCSFYSRFNSLITNLALSILFLVIIFPQSLSVLLIIISILLFLAFLSEPLLVLFFDLASHFLASVLSCLLIIYPFYNSILSYDKVSTLFCFLHSFLSPQIFYLHLLNFILFGFCSYP